MSSVLTIRGGVPLTGRVTVRGAKNLVPKAMVAALLGNVAIVAYLVRVALQTREARRVARRRTR